MPRKDGKKELDTKNIKVSKALARTEIISRLQQMDMYDYGSPAVKDLIEDVLSIPIKKTAVDRIAGQMETEEINVPDEVDIALNMYVINAVYGAAKIQEPRGLDRKKFLLATKKRFTTGGPLSI
jgi:hypothetical protein